MTLVGVSSVFVCDKREAFAQRSEATKQAIVTEFAVPMDCFARNDG